MMNNKKCAPPKKAPLNATGKPAAKGATTAPPVGKNPIIALSDGKKLTPPKKGKK